MSVLQDMHQTPPEKQMLPAGTSSIMAAAQAPSANEAHLCASTSIIKLKIISMNLSCTRTSLARCLYRKVTDNDVDENLQNIQNSCRFGSAEPPCMIESESESLSPHKLDLDPSRCHFGLTQDTLSLGRTVGRLRPSMRILCRGFSVRATQYTSYSSAYLSAWWARPLSRIVLHGHSIDAHFRARAPVALLGSLS